MAWKGTAMEKILTTKEKIIFESLRLFSQKGYDGVSMREIATVVGIKGASIYNHFKGKEEIFNAIFDEMKAHYDNAAISMNIPVEQNDDTVNMYLNIDEKGLLKMAESLLCFFCKDEFTVMFRKLLMSEQHRFPLAANMLKQYYIDVYQYFLLVHLKLKNYLHLFYLFAIKNYIVQYYSTDFPIYIALQISYLF